MSSWLMVLAMEMTGTFAVLLLLVLLFVVVPVLVVPRVLAEVCRVAMDA